MNVLNKVLLLCFCAVLATLNYGCKPHKDADDEDAVEKNIKAKSLVTLISVSQGLLSDSIVLNATSAFLKKNSLKSDAVGYIDRVEAHVGDYVQQGQVLFTIKTKESTVLHSKAVDSLLNFKGVFEIKASSAGVISEVDKQMGDYVADGEQLCIIAQKSSLVFLLNVPYEYNQYVHNNASCTLELPDLTTLSATIGTPLSSVDAASQTQTYVVKANSDKAYPENLIVKVKLNKGNSHKAATLPKEAVLSDETQEHFWVMKLINDSLAVKVPIIKGIETGLKIEVKTPNFSATDRFLLTGNYGLPDSALVQIVKQGGNE